MMRARFEVKGHRGKVNVCVNFDRSGVKSVECYQDYRDHSSTRSLDVAVETLIRDAINAECARDKIFGDHVRDSEGKIVARFLYTGSVKKA